MQDHLSAHGIVYGVISRIRSMRGLEMYAWHMNNLYH